MTETNLGYKGSESEAAVDGCPQWGAEVHPLRPSSAAGLMLANSRASPTLSALFAPGLRWVLRTGGCHEDAVSGF